MPILLKPGAVVPYNPEMKVSDGDVWDGLQVLVNGPSDGERIVEIVEAKDVRTVTKLFTMSETMVVKGLKGVEVIYLSKP